MKKILIVSLLFFLASCSPIGGGYNNQVSFKTDKEIYDELKFCQKDNKLMNMDCIEETESYEKVGEYYDGATESLEEMNKCNYLATSGEIERYSECLKNVYVKYPSNPIGNIALCTSYLVEENYQEVLKCTENFKTEDLTMFAALEGFAYFGLGNVEKGIQICKTALVKTPELSSLIECINMGESLMGY